MDSSPPELIVTNFNHNFTGVSATAAGATRQMVDRCNLRLCGSPLPGCPRPISLIEALGLSRRPPGDRRFVIWHVRRNSEMRWALFARDVLRLPIRIVFTSAAQRKHSALPRWLISRMDAVIATTEDAAKLVPNVRAVIPHGVDTERFLPATERSVMWAQSGFTGARGIANVGRLRPEKGTDVFVRAMIEVLPRFPDTVAVLFGDTQARDRPFVDRLRAEVAAAGLAERIRFFGEIEPERLAAVLPGFSLLVACPHYEGYGMTVLEAMACGVPFVATDTGAFRGFADEGRAGEIVPVGDAAALAKAVGGWLCMPQRIETAGLVGRENAVRRHSVEREADGIAQVYECLWGSSR